MTLRGKLRTVGRATLAIALAALIPEASLGDDFARLEGEALIAAPSHALARIEKSLTFEQIGNLPRVLREARASLLVVQTSDGNLARLLVSLAYRKAPSGQGDPAPILVIERFDTFELPGARNRLAQGRELILFDGFRLDLDLGQVVPDGQGGDIQFVSQGNERPRLIPLGKASLYTFLRSPLPAETAPGRPSSGRTVVPSDFAGRYRLVANGQWSGELELTIDADDHVSGRFRSDQTGSSYHVTGQISRAPAHRIELTIQFPRSRMQVEGWLWTEGKAAFSGTAMLQERPYGFVAVREGDSIEPTGIVIDRPGPLAASDGIVIVVNAEGLWKVGDRAVDDEGLLELLKNATVGGQAPRLVVQVASNTVYKRVARLLELVQSMGITDIRVAAVLTGTD